MARISIYSHVAGGDELGLHVNSYLVETPESVFVVDTSLRVSDSRALAAEVASLGKPLAGVFITHAHPDHFNGIIELMRHREAPVYATEDVARVIEEIADAKRAQWGPVYGGEWPRETYVPNSLLPDNGSVVIDGVTVRVQALGPGESHADSIFHLTCDDVAVAFVGDVAFHGMHAYMADGHTARWLHNLDELHSSIGAATTVYPGHGAPTDAKIFAEQRDYLRTYRAAVSELADGSPQLSEAAKEELVQRMTTKLPKAPLTWMIPLGADAVAAELFAAEVV